MLKYITQLFIRPSYTEQQRRHLRQAQGALLDAQLDLEWAEARVSCLKASVDRLSLSTRAVSHKDDWLTMATFD